MVPLLWLEFHELPIAMAEDIETVHVINVTIDNLFIIRSLFRYPAPLVVLAQIVIALDQAYTCINYVR